MTWISTQRLSPETAVPRLLCTVRPGASPTRVLTQVRNLSSTSLESRRRLSDTLNTSREASVAGKARRVQGNRESREAV